MRGKQNAREVGKDEQRDREIKGIGGKMSWFGRYQRKKIYNLNQQSSQMMIGKEAQSRKKFWDVHLRRIWWRIR